MAGTNDFQTVIRDIQEILKQERLDGWLLYNFRGSNVFASRLLTLPEHLMFTRRYFYFIPKKGEPRRLVHRIENLHLDSLPGSKDEYLSWQSLAKGLKKLLRGAKVVAMEYSPGCAIPYVATVDAGTVELVKKSAGVKVVSSANLVARFEATWNDEQMKDNAETANHLRAVVDVAFGFIRDRINAGTPVTEYDVQQRMLEEFHQRGIVSNSDPNCSVNANAANPHYEPTKDIFSPIKSGDLVLLDLWAKKDKRRSVYADITWMGYVGTTVPEEYEKVFRVLCEARDAAVTYVRQAFAKKKEVRGFEVDDATRAVVVKKGFGKYFVHRTGHSIGEEVHGNGANIDNLETHDERKLLPMSSFSVEPGIYFTGKYGLRTEIDVVITREKEVVITGAAPQERIVPILA
jgi:Xaa-Pro aminopeptidase